MRSPHQQRQAIPVLRDVAPIADTDLSIARRRIAAAHLDMFGTRLDETQVDELARRLVAQEGNAS